MDDAHNRHQHPLDSSHSGKVDTATDKYIDPYHRNGHSHLGDGAYKHGIKKLQMLVVRGVTAPIPCDTKMEYHVSNILISDREITRKQRYKDFDYTLFRHIEESLRPHETYLI